MTDIVMQRRLDALDWCREATETPSAKIERLRQEMLVQSEYIETLRELIQAFIAHLEKDWLPSQYDKDDYPESCLLIQRGHEALGDE
jgi:hypothetical protein